MSVLNGCSTLTEECPTLPKLAIVQNKERSAADFSRFKSGNAQYAFVKAKFIDVNQTPKFASNTDYIAWKRMNAINNYGKNNTIG